MKILKRLFSKREAEEKKDTVDEINPNYVCLRFDPINTVKDLREGEWNMDKVREGLLSGTLRYARQSEVEKAKEIGRISTRKGE